MSEFLGYLERLKAPPADDELSDAEKGYIAAHFEPHAAEVYIDGQMIYWDHLEEIEVVAAARTAGVSGWLVKQFFGGERYHIGFYFGKNEQVLTNLPFNAARYLVQMTAYYAPNPVRYSGVEGLSPIRFAD
jgi:hypothetical protein